MASRKTRAKRRQERMQQLQRSAVASPAQMRIEELNALKEIHPLEEQPASLQDEWEPIPAKEVEQRIECVPLERIVTEQYQRILNMKNVAGIVKNFDPAKLGQSADKPQSVVTFFEKPPKNQKEKAALTSNITTLTQPERNPGGEGNAQAAAGEAAANGDGDHGTDGAGGSLSAKSRPCGRFQFHL